MAQGPLAGCEGIAVVLQDVTLIKEISDVNETSCQMKVKVVLEKYIFSLKLMKLINCILTHTMLVSLI